MATPSPTRRTHPSGLAVVICAGTLMVGAGFAGVGGAAAERVADTAKVDRHALPLGDGKVSTTGPKRGYVYRCGASTGGGGAFADGPWIKDDGTFDLTEKVTVDGAVDWPQASFTSTVENGVRRLATNDLPVGETTGIFPISSTDDAYLYDRNPNSIAAQSLNYSLPAKPQKGSLAGASCLTAGPIGIALDGVAIFDGLDAGDRDAVAHEIQDSCGGHPQMSGLYHYHALPLCLTQTKSKRSKLVGFALDGFPIFNGRDEDGKRLANADLDACHGRTSVVKLDGEKVKTYHYEATLEYPYTLGCFRAAPVSSGG
jgi:hypothetical protein